MSDTPWRRTLAGAALAVLLVLPVAPAGATRAPAPPRLAASAADGQVTLRWTLPRDGVSTRRIRIHRRALPARWRRAPLARVSRAPAAFTDRRVTNGRTYVYRARLLTRGGRWSRMSAEVRATPRRRAAPQPRAPAPGPGGETPATTAREPGAPPAPGGPSSPPGTAGCATFGPYHAGALPPACWKPYAATSPFNRPIPDAPRIAADSAAIVARLRAWGAPQKLLAGHSGTAEDYFHPLYYARSSDPLFTVRCATHTRSCAVEGLRVRIPDAAQPAGGGDGHLAVVDQATGWEYDFWQVRSKPSGGGTLTVSHGGRTRIDGDGLGSNATAAWFGLAAGVIRGPEMLAGDIGHALFAAVKCTAGVSVLPAQPGATANACADFGLSNAGAPPLGARIQLAMSDAEIAALPVPAWKRTILRALARYGLIVGDTNGGHAAWGLMGESGSSYTSFGDPDPWVTVARAAGLAPFDGMYAFDIGAGVDWSRLRVLDPCVSTGTC